MKAWANGPGERSSVVSSAAPANTDDWGADQLGGVAIGPGVTRTINVSWDQSSIKLVGVDQEGCFITTTASASSELEWTITADSPRNCGH